MTVTQVLCCFDDLRCTVRVHEVDVVVRTSELVESFDGITSVSDAGGMAMMPFGTHVVGDGCIPLLVDALVLFIESDLTR